MSASPPESKPKPLADKDGSSPRSERPKRLGLFQHFSGGTLAAIGLGAAAIGLGSLGLEIGVAGLLDERYGGAILGLPVPFVSAPLGLSALLISALLAARDWRLSLYPLIGALVYWCTAISLWLSI